MRYALLICTEDKQQAEMTEAEAGTQMAGYMAWGEEMGGRGVLQAGERLKPSATATTVRVRDGETLTTDGPFAETKDQLGGFYLVDCKDLDEAIEVAARIPDVRRGSIEIRPIMEVEMSS